MESYSKLSYYFMQACLGYNRVQIEDFKMQERQTRALLPYMPSFITALEHSTRVASKAYKTSDLKTEPGSLRFNLPLQ